MATFVLSGIGQFLGGFDNRLWAGGGGSIIGIIQSNFSTSHSPTHVTYGSGANILTANGSFPTFDANGDPTSGTIQSFSQTGFDLSGSLTANVTGLSLSVATVNTWIAAGNADAFNTALIGGDDAITGTSAPDILYGYGGSDTINGGDGDDEIRGESLPDPFPNYGVAGNDTLNGGAGNDLMFGDDGNDTLNGGADNDQLNGGSGNDTLNGDGGNDTLNGGVGVDNMFGGAGDDVISATSGGTLDGGDGVDRLGVSFVGLTIDITLDYAQMLTATGVALADGTVIRNAELVVATTGAGDDTFLPIFGTAPFSVPHADGGAGIDRVVADLSAAAFAVNASPTEIVLVQSNGASAGAFTLANIERLLIVGGAFNDRLIGGGGDDVLSGGGGADSIYGEAGNNTLSGGDGDDTLSHRGGVGVIDGGAGNDYISLDFSAETAALNISSAQLLQPGGWTLADGTVIQNVEGFSGLVLGTGADTFTFAAGTLGGGNTQDFNGNGGSDTLVIDYSAALGAAFIFNHGLNHQLGLSFFVSFEQFVGIGSPQGDRFEGTGGNDTFSGNGGNDTLVGFGGDDTLNGGTGTDTLDGGDGIDFVDFNRSGSALAFFINSAGLASAAGATLADGTTIKNVERFAIVTGSGADVLNVVGALSTGPLGQVNSFDGGADNDRLVGDFSTTSVAINSFLTWSNVEELQIQAGNGNDVIDGGSGADQLSGNAGDDTLRGNAGDDVLNGGTGADALIGGAGDDAYFVDTDLDIITELVGEGIDAVNASSTYFLFDNVENLTLTGVAAINGSGNGLANVITGNGAANQLFGFAGNDTLDGGIGADSLFGGLGDDLYIVDNAADFAFEGNVAWGLDLVQASVSYVLGQNIDNLTLVGAALVGNGNLLANVIVGNANANTLFGMAGNDTLNGGAGADQMFGGLGDDLYIVDNGADFTFEAQSAWGVDTVQANVDYQLGQNIDNLVLQAGAGALIGRGNLLANTLTGNESANTLFGFAGNDTLDGGLGADQLYGREGDDAYIVDNVGDVVAEVNAAWGTDTIFASVTYFLSPNIEHLTLTGAANINGNGNGLNNTLTGNSGANTLSGQLGNDTLDGGAGADALFGGEGDDTYIVDNAGDVGFEASAAWGIDLVQASVSHTLGTNLDNLTLTGASAINGTGNNLANVIAGNSAANQLFGLGGADTLNGGAGNDALDGGAGDDAFVFAPGSGSDTITGFVAGGAEDSINLSAYNGSGVTWTITQSGADTVFAFSNGDQITLSGVTAANLVQTDPFGYS